MFDVRNEKLPRWWGLVPLRLIVGYGFIAHGAAKWIAGPRSFGKFLHVVGAPAPVATAWVVMLLEIFGGVAIVAGIFVEIVSVPLIISMLVAIFTVHIRYGFSSVHTIGLTPQGGSSDLPDMKSIFCTSVPCWLWLGLVPDCCHWSGGS